MKSILVKQGKSSFIISQLPNGLYKAHNQNNCSTGLDTVMSEKTVNAWIANLKKSGFMVAELS